MRNGISGLMMRRLFSAGLFCGLLQGQVNLLQDGGMENWSSDIDLACWVKEANVLARETSVRHGGNSSAKLTRKSSNTGFYQDAAVSPGSVYTFKAWLFNASDTVKAGLLISWYTAGNSPAGYDGPVKAGTAGEWQQAVLTAEAPDSAATARCRIRIYDKKGGPCYADDAEFNADTPLSVGVQGCYAVREGAVVALHWSTQSETGTAGFMVLRSEREEGPYEAAATALIPGQGNSSSGRNYLFRDYNAEPDRTYWYQIEELETGGKRRTVGTACVRPPEGAVFPGSSALECGYPNPFNPRATLRFSLSGGDADEGVSLGVYSLLGGKIRDLDCGAAAGPGIHSVEWDGRDHGGRDAEAGIYFLVLRNKNGILASRRIVKIK
jgi:hypothetical protein